MQAASIEEFGAPLQIGSLRPPDPGPGEVAVTVAAVGLCGTDLKIQSGAFDLALPLVPGHEIAGQLVAVGPGVDPGRVGERVACYYYSTCGSCRYCSGGQENLCEGVRRLGFERAGGMAERVICPAENAIPIPPGVPYDLAATAMDALATPLRGLSEQLRLVAGESLLVVGAGGLGLNAVQVATSLGARVAVCEPVTAKRALAVRRGAQFACSPTDASDLASWSGFPPDVVIEVSGTQAGLGLAVEMVRRGGRLGVFGYQPDTSLQISSQKLVLEEIQIRGMRGGSLGAAREALRLLGSGQLTVDIAAHVPLKDVNRAYDLLRKGDQPGRIVVVPQDAN